MTSAPLRLLALALFSALLTACGSVPSTPSSRSSTQWQGELAPEAIASAPANTASGPWAYDTDGLPPQVPPDLHLVPDPAPRVEPIRSGGPNKPYEVAGQVYVPWVADVALLEEGGASWYGRKYHGRRTSNGEVYDMFGMSAAHPTMPLPSYARVVNPANGRSVIVRVNDRGPFVPGRVIDLSYTAALKLDVHRGVRPVRVERLTADAIRAWQALEGRLAWNAPPSELEGFSARP